MLETFAVIGDVEKTFAVLGVAKVRKLVFLVVNAETTPDIKSYQVSEIPSLSHVSRALLDIPVNRYSIDTLHLMRISVESWRTQLRQRASSEGSVFAPDAEIYFINASLSEVADPKERDYLMKIPTSLHLTDEQIDRLLLAASHLIHNDKDFQRLMEDLR